MVTRTYLDHNASGPLRPEARAAVIAALDVSGNASSVHAEGRRARGLIDEAREAVAALVGARPQQVVFTSCATESNNWVMRSGWDRLIVGATEHESVLAPARAADPAVVEVPCDGRGIFDPDFIEASLAKARPGRTLVSLHLANAETGVIQPVETAAVLARDAGARIHCDAVQGVGRVLVDFNAIGVDLMSISAHKIGGPKGIGALVVRDGCDLPALLAGGGQERRRRSGTENVAAIAGFGAAATAARRDLADIARIEALRDRLEDGVAAITPEAVIIGAAAERLANTSCIALPGAQASTLLIRLDLAGIAVSAGSACSSGKIGRSHVLEAMGIDERLSAGAIRISLGPTSTDGDVDAFLAAWEAINRLHAVQLHRTIGGAGAQSRPLVGSKAGE